MISAGQKLLLFKRSRTRTPVEKLLDLVGMGYLAPSASHMLYPNDPSRSAGNRHYLNIAGTWVDPTTLDASMGAMVGTLNADGTGGSLSYTPEIVAPTMVEGISILYTASNVVVPILSMGFNRALTAGERTALSGLITPIAVAAGVSVAACSLVTGQEFQQRVLKMKVNTALAGSANDSFVLPADGAGTYAYTVDWGNGTREYVTANTAKTKDYDSTSTFIVSVYGTYRPYFNNGGDKAKLLGLQIGATSHTMANAFYGCSALTSLVGYAGIAAVTNMAYMFDGCTAFKQSLAAFNMAAATLITDTCAGCNLNAPGTTTNYDNTLIAWAAKDLVNSLTFNAGTSKYGGDAGSGGQQARTAIATNDLWTFVDGGHI